MEDDEAENKFEADARAALETIEKCLMGALAPRNKKILAAQDRDHLEWALKTLRPSFDGLSELLREVEPSRFSCGYEALLNLLIAAFAAGHGGVTKTAKNFKEASQAAKAREAQATISTARRAKLIEAILAEAKEKKLTLAPNKEFSGLIRPRVRERLGLPAGGKDYPSIGAIKAAISEIKSAKA